MISVTVLCHTNTLGKGMNPFLFSSAVLLHLSKCFQIKNCIVYNVQVENVYHMYVYEKDVYHTNVYEKDVYHTNAYEKNVYYSTV